MAEHAPLGWQVPPSHGWPVRRVGVLQPPSGRQALVEHSVDGQLVHAGSARARGEEMNEKTDRRTELLFLWTIGVGVLFSGVAFAYKIAGFIHVLTSPDFKGTFEYAGAPPITVIDTDKCQVR